MKINSAKVNSFGKLSQREFNFEKLNLIYGKNETGKSTLLNFIFNIFCGISKLKNKKIISDFDKYNPWNKSEFSGKVSYNLDDGEAFSVFREFSKNKAEKMLYFLF